MKIPQLRKAEKRLILTVGRHQSDENPKSMSELATEIEEEIQTMQKGKSTINENLIEIENAHPKKIIRLSEQGEKVYDLLEKFIVVLE